MARVIKQTETTAIIQGLGRTQIEAKIKAEEKAKSLFGNFKETGSAECTREYYESYNASQGNLSGGGGTYWSCTIQVEKIK